MVDPPIVEIKASGGVSVHQILNASSQRLAFKIKSSNNINYTLKPVYGFVEPGTSEPIVVTRTNGPAGIDKLVVEFSETTAMIKDAQVFWKGRKACGEVIVPLISS